MIPYCALEEAALNWGDRAAIVSERFGEVSFENLLARTALLAGALSREGLKQGDVLATHLPNCLEVIELYLAASSLGVALQSLDVCLGKEYLAEALACSNAKALAVCATNANIPEEELHGVHVRLVVDGEREGWREYESFLNSAVAPASVADVDEQQDAALLVRRSDAAGPARWVTLTWAQLDFFPYDMIGMLGLGPEDRYTALVPMAHVSGPLSVNLCLIAGCSCVVSDVSSLDGIFDRLEKHRVTAMHTVSSVAGLLLQGDPQERDLSAMRFVVLTDSGVSTNLLTALEEAIPSAKAVRGYWPAVAASLLTLLAPDSHAERRGSMGVPLSGAEIRLLDSQGREVPMGESGEVVVRGGKVFKSYYGDPELTARVIRDGCLHTGDIAARDEDGFYYYLGRRQYLAEVESALLKYPGVKEAVAYGIPDESRGHIVVAEVVPEKGTALNEIELRQSMLGCLAHHEAPVRIDIVEAATRAPNRRPRHELGG